MTLVSNFNPSKRTVHVESGVTVKELNEKLKAVGYEFPIYPANGGISSIGGMTATNASGNKSMKYGHMKDWIEEIEFVNGNAELLKTSKTDLMEVCGLEGITGIITGATLRVTPIIKKSISVFQSSSIDEILSVSRQLKQEKETSMLAFFSKQVSKFLGFSESYYIIIEFDSERGKITGEEYEELSKIKERAYKVLFSEGYYNSEDPKLFFDTIKEFVLFLEEKNIPYFGDLGEGIIMPFFKDNEKAKKDEITELIKKMRVKLGKYGYGLTRKNSLDSFEARLFQRVKIRHDPYEKFNKNKLIGIDASLKKSVTDVYKRREPQKIKITEKEEDTLEFVEQARKELKTEGIKTPEEKLHEFIKKVEIIDKTSEKDVPKEVSKIEQENLKQEIKERLKDYEETFESELPEERRKKIEEFAKNIPKETLERQDFNQEKFNQENNKKRTETSESEKDMINKILGNRFKPKENKSDNQDNGRSER